MGRREVTGFQCLQVYGFIRILDRIMCKNTEYGKIGEKY